MNFQKLLNVADSNRVAAQSEASVKRYSTILAPPKKPPKANVQSGAIKKFLAKKEEEEKQKALEEQRKKEELLSLRAQNTKNSKKAKIMASRTKDNDFSKIRMTDDDLVAKKEREAKILRLSLNNKRERMKARIDMEDEEKLLPHKRKRKSKHDNIPEMEVREDQFYFGKRIGEQSNSTLKLRGEFHLDTRLSTKETNKKSRPNLPHASAPPVSFHDLLKMAATKQYQPIELPKVKVPETNERPLTKKEIALLRTEDARLRRKVSSNDEQDLTRNKMAPPHTKSKNTVLNSNNSEHIKRNQSQKFPKSNGDIERSVSQVSDFHIPKHNSNIIVPNRNSSNFSSKADSYENSSGECDTVKGSFHKKHTERNSSEQRLQNHHNAPPRQKGILKTSETYVGVQNGQRSPNDVKKIHQTEYDSALRKVPHSNNLQNTRPPKSASIGNISEGFKRPSNSGNTVNMQKERNSHSSNVQSVKNTSHAKPLSEHRSNSDTFENIKKSATKGTKSSKSTCSLHKPPSKDRILDKRGEFSNSSAISSSREIHSSAIRKDSVSTKVPGKVPNTRNVGYASQGHDMGQHSTSSDHRSKNCGKQLFESQERMQNVRRRVENRLAKSKGSQERTPPVDKLSAKPEMMKRPLPPSAKFPPARPPPPSAKLPPARPPSSAKLPPARPPPSSTKLPLARPSSVKLPPARPPSSSAKFPPARPSSLPTKLHPSRPPTSASLSPARPPIKPSPYPRNPYLDPPRRLLESHRPQKMPMKRRIESDEEDDDDMSDFIDDDPCDDQADVSKFIKEIFNYDRSRYFDDDDDDVMETPFAEQMKEEVRSAKIGRLEDLEDMRLEEEEKKRKKKKMKK